MIFAMVQSARDSELTPALVILPRNHKGGWPVNNG
jgi:hypothetical protein